MDTLGPRIMVNVGTQAVSNTGLNPRDLAPLTNDAFLATFTGKAPLPASTGISRPHNNNNNYRQSYTTQMERLTLRSKQRPSAPAGESIEPDSAILSIIRGNGSESHQQQPSQRQPSGTRNRRRSLNQQLLGGWNDLPCSPNYRPVNEGSRRRRTRSGGAQQQISVVDQMAAQPHIPYAILPKRFEPKQVAGNGLQQQSRSSNNNNNNNLGGGNRRRRQAAPRRSQRQQEFYDEQWEDDEDDDLWLEPMPPMMMMNRRFARRPNRSFNPPPGYYGPRRLDDYYDSYAYGPMPRQGPMPLRSRRRMTYPDEGYVPFDIVPSYDLNEWQGPYARPRQSLYAQQRNGGRFGNGFIRDDHRMNGSSRQSRNGNKPSTPTRNGKQAKSPKNGKGPQKRRTSRQRKQRNQNSKTEGTPLTSTNDNELTTDDKLKQETTDTDAKPLPPRDHENKENNGEVKSE